MYQLQRRTNNHLQPLLLSFPPLKAQLRDRHQMLRTRALPVTRMGQHLPKLLIHHYAKNKLLVTARTLVVLGVACLHCPKCRTQMRKLAPPAGCQVNKCQLMQVLKENHSSQTVRLFLSLLHPALVATLFRVSNRRKNYGPQKAQSQLSL